MAIVESLERDGFNIPIKHVITVSHNKFPDTHLDMVRAGIILYGLYPMVSIKKNSFKSNNDIKTQVLIC